MDAAELIARIKADNSGLVSGLQQADGIVRQGAATLNRTAQTAGTGMGRSIGGGLDAGLRSALGRTVSTINPQLGAIVGAASAAAAGIAVVAAAAVAAKGVWDLAVEGAQAAELRDAYIGIAGGVSASAEMMEKLKRATQGTVRETDLMVIANRALQMGVTTTADEAARLAAIFTRLGEASGMGAQESVLAGMNALGSLQTRGLKTLGLSIDDTKVWDAYAAKIGTTASALDDVQKRAALVQEVLSMAPTGLDDATASAADKVDAMKVAAQDFKTHIGESLVEVLGLADAARAVIEELDKPVKRGLQAERLLQEYADAYERAVSQMKPLEVFTNAAGEQQAMRGVQQQAAMLSQQMKQLADQVRVGRMSYEEAEVAIRNLLGPMALIKGSAIDGALGVAQMKQALSEEAAAAEAAAAKTAAAEAQFSRFAFEMNNWGWANIAAAGGYVTSGPNEWAMGMGGTNLRATATKKWSYSPPKSLSTGGGGFGSASSWESDMRAQASEMRSLVESILQPTSVTAADMAASRAGTYVDAWDEYARKMRAIAADQGSVWRQMVPVDIINQGEDAIRGWAEQQEKLFYTGQMPDQINWDDFVNRAREEIASQQAREALIATAASKLAEAGIGGVNAANLLGLGSPGAQIGTDAASAFATGAAQTDVGGQVTKAFGESITAQAETWQGYGKIAISYFITGGESAITPDTGRLFAERLWPYFADVIRREEAAP